MAALDESSVAARTLRAEGCVVVPGVLPPRICDRLLVKLRAAREAALSLTARDKTGGTAVALLGEYVDGQDAALQPPTPTIPAPRRV